MSDKLSTSAQAAAPTKSRPNAFAVVVLVLGILAILQAPYFLATWVATYIISADPSTPQDVVGIGVALSWALVVILLGHAALARSKARGESPSDRTGAMAGLLLAYISVATWVLMFAGLLYLQISGTHFRM